MSLNKSNNSLYPVVAVDHLSELFAADLLISILVHTCNKRVYVLLGHLLLAGLLGGLEIVLDFCLGEQSAAVHICVEQ